MSLFQHAQNAHRVPPLIHIIIHPKVLNSQPILVPERLLHLLDARPTHLGGTMKQVLVYRGQYAGTWSAKDHGGELFGKIVRGQ